MTWFGSGGEQAMADVAKVLDADWYLALMLLVLLFGVALLDRRPRRPRHHLVSHRKLRAATARRGPAAGLHARCNAPAAGAQLSRAFWRETWLAERYILQLHHRGSVAVPGDVETLPAAGTHTAPAAGPNDRANPSDTAVAARTNPATGTLPPVAGPQQPADAVIDPRHGVGRPPTPARSAA